MKNVEEVVACVVDYGTFASVAERLAQDMAEVYYYNPLDTEYLNVGDCMMGTGLEGVIKCDDLFDIIRRTDLFVFPDIGFSGLQKYLRDIGKAVWGHMGATELELYRDYFIKVLKRLGLPTVPSKTIVGLSKLKAYLATVTNKWVKVNRYRGNMETWKHVDIQHSARMLDCLSVVFGGGSESVVFVVQDDIEADIEIGYDGWCIDGTFPEASFSGYEDKDELYLGSWQYDWEMNEYVRDVNNRFGNVLAVYGYRCWWATEIRIKDGVPYFIDPTPRHAGLANEGIMEAIENFPQVVWQGANGILIKPVWRAKFVAEATLHNKLVCKDDAIASSMASLKLPRNIDKQWYKFYHYFNFAGTYHFLEDNELAVVIGMGNDAMSAIEHLRHNIQLLKGLPVEAEIAGFAALLDQAKKAEEEGIPFGGRIPSPPEIFEDTEGL